MNRLGEGVDHVAFEVRESLSDAAADMSRVASVLSSGDRPLTDLTRTFSA